MADLSGAWLGTYWQRNLPVRFEMTLIQGDNTLSGRILDNNHLGEASLVGRVSGRSVNFTKTYLISSRHSVSYTGTISEDGNKVEGKWQIGFFSGNWEALRNDENLSLEKATRKQDKEPILSAI